VSEEVMRGGAIRGEGAKGGPRMEWKKREEAGIRREGVCVCVRGEGVWRRGDTLKQPILD